MLQHVSTLKLLLQWWLGIKKTENISRSTFLAICLASGVFLSTSDYSCTHTGQGVSQQTWGVGQLMGVSQRTGVGQRTGTKLRE